MKELAIKEIEEIFNEIEKEQAYRQEQINWINKQNEYWKEQEQEIEALKPNEVVDDDSAN